MAKGILSNSFVAVFILLLCGCSYPVQFVDFQTSNTLSGTLGMGDHTFEVKMADGKILKGSWACSSDARIGAGVLAYEQELASLLTVSGSGQHKCYGILTGYDNTVMELMFLHNEMGWSPHGFGVAITNKGERYRIIY